MELPRIYSWHDVQRVSDGVVIGSIRAEWYGDGSEQILDNGIPAGGDLRGAEAYGNVPAGVIDLFCGVYGERAAEARRLYRFVPDPGF